MPVEIERKFLVVSETWRATADPGRRFRQGYLANDGEANVRVRRAGETAYITVKGARVGIARLEFEYEIPIDDAEEMLDSLCAKPLLEKTRHCVRHAGLTWEVDVFEGASAGLVVAEVELAHIDQLIVLPDWAGADVSHDPRYRSSAIAAADELPPRD